MGKGSTTDEDALEGPHGYDPLTLAANQHAFARHPAHSPDPYDPEAVRAALTLLEAVASDPQIGAYAEAADFQQLLTWTPEELEARAAAGAVVLAPLRAVRKLLEQSLAPLTGLESELTRQLGDARIAKARLQDQAEAEATKAERSARKQKMGSESWSLEAFAVQTLADAFPLSAVPFVSAPGTALRLRMYVRGKGGRGSYAHASAIHTFGELKVRWAEGVKNVAPGHDPLELYVQYRNSPERTIAARSVLVDKKALADAYAAWLLAQPQP